jgi:phospholipid/cholesterol/gamma-HCH transport system substrate-binding protein
MGRNVIETILGAVVLIMAGLFLSFAYSSADLQKVKGYTVNAYFPMVDGVKDGTDVKINGVKVGSVSNLGLVTTPGPNEYKVDVKMTITPNVRLPMDTIAMVASESLLGGKYMALEVGVEEDMIKTDGTGRITHTQAPMRLDDLIGQLIYGSKKNEGNGQGAAAPSSAAPAPAAPAPTTAPKATNGAATKKAAPTPGVYSPPQPSGIVETAPAPASAPVSPVESAHP